MAQYVRKDGTIKEFKVVNISLETYSKLNQLKLVASESFDSVISRIANERVRNLEIANKTEVTLQ